MRSILTTLIATGAFAAISFATAAAHADDDDEYNPIHRQNRDDLRDAIYGLGTSHLASAGLVYLPRTVFDYEENEANPPVSGSGLFQMSLALFPLPTIFGALGGVEMDMTLGFPLFKGYFGGFGASAGVMLQPISFRHFRVSLALGAGLNAHAFGYVKPRVAFTLIPDRADIEVTYRWIPQYASNVFGGREDDLEDPGFGEDRLRVNLFIRVGAFKESNKYRSAPNLHLFFDYTRIAGDLEELQRVKIKPGDYLGFGLGMAY